jgi:ribosomal protein L32E
MKETQKKHAREFLYLQYLIQNYADLHKATPNETLVNLAKVIGRRSI